MASGEQLVVHEDITTAGALQRRMEQLTALSQASQAVTASLELDRVLSRVVSLAGEAVGSDYTTVVLVDEAGQVGPSAEDLPWMPVIEHRIREAGFTNWIIRSGQPVIIDHIAEDGAISPELGAAAPRHANPYIVEAGVKSVAGLPLSAKGNLLGVLYLHSLRPANFCGQLSLLITFANQAAIAIENARLYQAAQREISERVRVEEALRKSEAQQRATLDAMGDVIHVIDTDWRYILVNTAFEQWTRELDMATDVIGRSLFEVCPFLSDRVRDEYRQVLDSGKMLVTEERINIGDREFFAETRKIPILEGDRVTQIVTVIRDITEQVCAQMEREALMAELEAKHAELKRFTYTVSHDLKSPLITITGFLGLLEQDMAAGDSAQMQDSMAYISKAAVRMEQLLNDLLELSRIGRLDNPPEEVPLGELAREAVDMVAGRLAERGVQVEIAPDLPILYGDRPRLRAVLQNLIDNAVKFMGDQPAPRIEVGTRCQGQELVYYVRDNGIGIDPRHHEKVFDLFEKLDSKVAGTGAGLAIVKRVVEVHGGRVWVESQGQGQGSTFCFTLANNDS